MIVTYIGQDFWCRDLYRSKKTHKVYANVDGVLHSLTDEGEPYVPVIKLSKVKVIPIKETEE
jgi:hypothetical protein